MSSPPLVDFLIIGAMKCGTTSLHHYLDQHPRIGMAPDKEVNFFFGTRPGGAGNFWRGTDWYRGRLPAHAEVRGEASPGYTSPDHPDVAGRIAGLVPDVRLVYLVRDPLARAVSQYRHHRRDGAETRDIADALLDEEGHYLRRSRYADRLEPFLEHFDPERIAVVDHEDLRHRTRATVSALCRFLAVDPVVPDGIHGRLNRSTGPAPEVPGHVASAFRRAVADDVEHFERIRPRLHSVRSLSTRAR